MGQIANQMVLEIFLKMKEKFKGKREEIYLANVCQGDLAKGKGYYDDKKITGEGYSCLCRYFVQRI